MRGVNISGRARKTAVGALATMALAAGGMTMTTGAQAAIAGGGQAGTGRAVAAAATGGPAIAAGAITSAAPAATCAPGLNVYNRFQVCWRVGVTVTVLRSGASAGTVTFDVTHVLALSARSLSFSEAVSVSDVQVAGNASGVQLGLQPACAAPCAVTSHFPQGQVIANGLAGTIDYQDPVAAGQSQAARVSYALSFTKPGDASGGYTYQMPVGFRCDDALAGLAGGCVFPSYTPYLTTLAALPDVARNAIAAEGGPGHYGKPGGGHPLHRVTSAAAASANYDAVCAPAVAGKPPRSGVTCDEFPLRASHEGGTAVGKADRRTAWVPASQETAKNSSIASFFAANRVLDGDGFWVSV
ncbi:MAG TPA: hypothetical protein VH478_22720 [Trebonia sp.]|jgi:hypothetical protein|nr:hypothetical protein [Trebonia sp.]